MMVDFLLRDFWTDLIVSLMKSSAAPDGIPSARA